MDKDRSIKLFATAGIALTLQGCVAVAFPIAAGGMMARGNGGDRETTSAVVEPPVVAQAAPQDSEPQPSGIVEVARSSDAAATAAGVAETVGARDTGTFVVEDSSVSIPSSEPEELVEIVTVEVPETSEAETFSDVFENTASDPVSAPATVEVVNAAPISVPASPSAPESEPELPSAAAVIEQPAAMAAVAPSTTEASTASTSGIVVPIPDAPRAVAGGTFFDPFFDYATAPEFTSVGKRPSAMLLNPAALEPDRLDCETGEPTVLIDLDPESGELFPIDPQSASPALAQRLAELRVKGVLIAWISQRFANREVDIRRALRDSGLDPLGIDEVLMMRTSDDRKQTRRDALARTSCLVAIAGDTRSDFHELFDYLLNPSDAVALEPLIGEGWFLIPTPLLAERTRP
ncbi:hypothetical protein [Erythrobacter sp. Alg231-14]|uniref:hypothetical protein n=1 Tax=Erythrobacter sp. Alg231-14 TaxID=1922225 RepID=UPI00307B8400